MWSSLWFLHYYSAERYFKIAFGLNPKRGATGLMACVKMRILHYNCDSDCPNSVYLRSSSQVEIETVLKLFVKTNDLKVLSVYQSNDYRQLSESASEYALKKKLMDLH